MKNKIHGFTLIELLIVIAIIGILMSLAVPTYLMYMQRDYFSEVVLATGPYKTAVEGCYQRQGGGAAVVNCAGGQNGVPANSTGQGNVGSINVAANGVITATGSALHNLQTETYILTPTPVNNTLIWAISGTCKTDSLC